VTITVPTDPILVHATAIAIEGRAVLLRGRSGAGKSDLALRLIEGGARLVADDQVNLQRAGDRVLVTAPAAIAGLLEVRGVGIVRIEAIAEATLAMLADLVPSEEVERFPEARREDVLGVPISSITLSPFEASAAAKLRLALCAFSAHQVPAIIRR
jgi:HPr kinase/phosphorylase